MQGLEATAVDRVRTFLLERIASLKPGSAGGASNATIRRQSLLAFAAYPAFLRAHSPDSYRAVLVRYCDDHRAHLFSSVKTYLTGLAAATQRRERPALVTAAELAGGSRIGSMFLPSARLRQTCMPQLIPASNATEYGATCNDRSCRNAHAVANSCNHAAYSESFSTVHDMSFRVYRRRRRRSPIRF